MAIPVDPPVKAEVAYIQARGRYDLYRVRLRGAGATATGQLLRPRQGAGPFPAVLLNDGRELNSAALEYLPAEFGDVVVLSLDYPAGIPYELGTSTLLLESEKIRRELRRIPRLFSLGAAYLTQRADVDSSRLAMVVTSFAVPFGVLAAAEDPRFRNVGLIYGAGDMAAVLEANLSVKPRFLRSVVAWLARQLYGEFEPTRHVAGIAPRPLIMVNGRDDPQMPVRAVQALYDAAHEPKTLIWLTTGHLQPTDRPLIRALVDTTLARLPVLMSEQRGVLAQERVSFPTQDGGLVYADLYGKGGHAVVLAHGGRFNKESWENQARALAAAGFRALAIDFRGYGQSRGPGQTDPLSAPLHLDVLAAVRYLKQTGAQTISVVGGSMGGGAAATALADANPGEIDRLVLLGSEAGSSPEKLKGRKLFITARDDTTASGTPRLIRIRQEYERTPDPKELVILEGSAHAQFIFQTGQGERLMREILRFLSAP
ncbi:MAG: alpha/beta fold hydrolase [Gemmatimonadaceae bacterium]